MSITPAPSYSTTIVDNALVALWYGECTAPVLHAFYAELEQHAARHPRGIYVLNVINDSAGMPDDAARAALESQFSAMRGRLLGLVVVLEKRGIMGTLSRAILSTLLTMTKRPFEMTIVSDREEAADWLAQRATPSSQRLLHALGALSVGEASSLQGRPSLVRGDAAQLGGETGLPPPTPSRRG